jgi:hypothetical protein
VGKSKPRKQPPPEHKKKFFTTRRLAVIGAIGGVTAAAIAALALGPSMYQTYLTDRQARLAAERPDLTMDLRVATHPQRDATGTRVTFEVSAENVGSRAADYFYWHLNVPAAHVTTAAYRSGNDVQPTKEKLPDGSLVLHFQGLVDKPQPRIGMTFGRLDLHIKPDTPTFNVRWQITCCDDMIFPRVPDTGDERSPIFGSIPVNTSTLQRWDVLKTTPAF